ncbi:MULTISPECIES: hypothetical protein [Bacillus]|nr:MULTISPECIES: hypothetical protein [Bacillus]MED1409262.1 hypothetical protein [Bacillus paramycoides]MED1462854.1 hypothetical protein [Bacillus paramycoides]MED1492472.1 hypothetical protein [Bacillus paramycoides]
MRKVLRHEGLGGKAGQYLKVEAARPECEEAKPLNILAAETG